MGEFSPPTPGLAWLDILQRRTPEAFASAFTPDAVLAGSVLREPARGAVAIREVFTATREMYEQIAFLHETRSGGRTYLEWEGHFGGRDVVGVTVLVHDTRDLIESVGLYHSPYEQVVSFSAELTRRLTSARR